MSDTATAAEHWVPLALAAQRLGLRWDQAWRLVLTGALRGEKRGGRWFVERDSLSQNLGPSAQGG